MCCTRPSKSVLPSLSSTRCLTSTRIRPSGCVLKAWGSTTGSMRSHWRVQYARTPSCPLTYPPSMPLGHSTSGCIIESTASMSRALNAAYALLRSSRTSADIGWSYMFLRTCCSHGLVFTDRHSTCASRSINIVNSLVSSYSPECMEGVFCELRLARVLGTSRLLSSLTFAAVAFVVDGHLAPIRQEQRHLPHRA